MKNLKHLFTHDMASVAIFTLYGIALIAYSQGLLWVALAIVTVIVIDLTHVAVIKPEVYHRRMRNKEFFTVKALWLDMIIWGLVYWIYFNADFIRGLV